LYPKAVAELPLLEVAITSNVSAGWSEGWDKKPDRGKKKEQRNDRFVQIAHGS